MSVNRERVSADSDVKRRNLIYAPINRGALFVNCDAVSVNTINSNELHNGYWALTDR